jgi:hypothetical protein
MGLLDGSLAEQIYAGFKGKLLTGIIRKRSQPESAALDSLGDPLELAPADTAIEGFTENYDDAFAARAGIPSTDIMVNIFAKSCPGIVPGKDDIVRMTQAGVATWYQLRRAKVDPAGALFICQAFVIPEPAE